jgi:hypothetical protein
MSESSTESKVEHVEGHEVHVVKDDSGIVAMSEDEEGADPGVGTSADDESDDDKDEPGEGEPTPDRSDGDVD